MKFVINIIYSSYQIIKFTIKQKKKYIIIDDDLVCRLNRPIIIISFDFDYFTMIGIFFF